MVKEIGVIIRSRDLSRPISAYMSGGVFSEKDGREVPDTIAVTLDYANDLTVTWQSTFSNSHYGLGERFLGSDGTVERLAGATDMLTGKSQTGAWYFPENVNRAAGTAMQAGSNCLNHIANLLECIRS